MDSIKDIANSIFYVNLKRQLVEYNLLTKHKRIHYQTKSNIIQYHLSDSDRIIITVPFDHYDECQVIWNNVEFHIRIPILDIGFVRIKEEIYIWFSWDGRIFKIDRNGNTIRFKRSYFNVSENMKRIALCESGIIHVMPDEKQIRCSNLTEPYLFDIYGSVALGHGTNSYNLWVKNSNRIITFCDHDNSVKRSLVNIDTLKKCCTEYYWLDFLMELRDDILFAVYDSTIIVYDINTMKMVKKFHCNLEFIAYSRVLDVLITNIMDYYRLTSELELQRVNVGENYVMDRGHVSNIIEAIMEIILDDSSLFCNLPQEISNIELYIAIITTNNFMEITIQPSSVRNIKFVHSHI